MEQQHGYSASVASVQFLEGTIAVSHATPRWKETEIARLLAEGKLSQCAIAKQVGVWHGIVGQIAAGTRKNYYRTRYAKKTKPVWCPECRTNVMPPCVACRARAAIARGQRRCWPPDPTGETVEADEFMGLDLTDEHAAIQREIKALKRVRGGGRRPVTVPNEFHDEFPDDAEWEEGPEL